MGAETHYLTKTQRRNKMPTISTENIEGFDSMTAEQKVEALLKVDIPEKIDLSGYIQKSQFDRVSSELAEAKKTLKGKLSEDEAAAAEREAKWAEMESKLKTLEFEKMVSTYKASYLAMPGFDENLAEDTANALANGDIKKVFANQQKANAIYEKKLRAELVKADPKPEGAGGGNEKTDTAVEFARQLGKQRADALKSANEGLKHYF